MATMIRGIVLLLASTLLCGCSDEMSAMRLTDGTAIHLDWTSIGGEHDRADRLLLAEDGTARRNYRGNLFTLTDLTRAERGQLEGLVGRHGRMTLERHSGPSVKHPNAQRLRFAGRGSDDDAQPVRDFAEAVLARLDHALQLATSDVVVAAVVDERDELGGAAYLSVVRVLKNVTVGDRLERLLREDRLSLHLPDARVGAGGATIVIALWAPTMGDERHRDWVAERAAYLKLKVDAVEKMLAP